MVQTHTVKITVKKLLEILWFSPQNIIVTPTVYPWLKLLISQWERVRLLLILSSWPNHPRPLAQVLSSWIFFLNCSVFCHIKLCEKSLFLIKLWCVMKTSFTYHKTIFDIYLSAQVLRQLPTLLVNLIVSIKNKQCNNRNTL